MTYNQINFDNYNHFSKYCLGICYNKKIKITNKLINVLKNFENVYEFLENLKNENKIYCWGNIFNKIIQLFKNNKINDTIDNLQYLNQSLDKIKNKIYDPYDFLNYLYKHLDVCIQFTETFILTYNFEDIFYPSKIDVLEICKDTEKVNIISLNNEHQQLHGIYFIYDEEEYLAYIGKSIRDVIGRSCESAVERLSGKFSKIEIRTTNSLSDVAIYEAYYISKYKPYCNREFIYEDDSSLILPDLPIIETISNNINRYSEFEYNYYKIKTCVISKIISNLNKTMFFNTYDNKIFLHNNGIFDKDTMKEKIYSNIMRKLRKNDFCNINDVINKKYEIY